jgi:hypothetical protein
MHVKTLLQAILFASAVTACAPQSDDRAPTTETATLPAPSLPAMADLDINVDAQCVEEVIAGNWHDDPEIDAPTILANAQQDPSAMNQNMIDALIDVTLQSDETCTDQVERAY